MTRYAFYAALTAAAIAAAAPLAEAQTMTEAQEIRRQAIERAQLAGKPAVDGRRLLAELGTCEEMSPQSVRARCEMQVRKSGGEGIRLTLDPNAEQAVMEKDQFERWQN